MKVDGRELQAIQNELDVSPERVCQEADLSMSTLYKVYANKRVSRNSVNRVRKAIEQLQGTTESLRTRSKVAG